MGDILCPIASDAKTIFCWITSLLLPVFVVLPCIIVCIWIFCSYCFCRASTEENNVEMVPNPNPDTLPIPESISVTIN